MSPLADWSGRSTRIPSAKDGSRPPAAFQTHYEQIATPFEWKFTKTDLNALLKCITAHDEEALELAA